MLHRELQINIDSRKCWHLENETTENHVRFENCNSTNHLKMKREFRKNPHTTIQPTDETNNKPEMTDEIESNSYKHNLYFDV